MLRELPPGAPDRLPLLAADAATERAFRGQPLERFQTIHLAVHGFTACDTGTGPLRGQEGTANLARAFLVAGARNVAAALWEVDDQFASVLMRHFYDHLRQGHDVSEALRMAKNDLRRRFGANATAFFWGSMIVTGDGRTKLTER